MERLRRLAINDAYFVDEWLNAEDELGELDPKTLALVRLTALVAIGSAVPSYGSAADAAVSAGATVAEMVATLVGIVPLVGLPKVVAAAPSLALALGYDLDDGEESSTGR
jgi:4-carboxymuconolactone decarboxylase